MRTTSTLGRALTIAALGALATLGAAPALAQSPPPLANAPPPYAPGPIYPAPAAAPNPGPMRPSPGPSWSVPGRDDGAVESFKRKKRFLIAGSIVFGLSYYAALVAGSVGMSRNNRGSTEWIAALFPVGGPFVAAGLRATPNLPQEADYAGTGFMLALGATQLLGAGLLVAGLRMPTGRAPNPCNDTADGGTGEPSPATSRRPCPPVEVSVQPIVTPTFAGAGFTGTF